MLENLSPAEGLRGLARRKSKQEEFRTVRHALVGEELAKGWREFKRNRNTSRLVKPKTHDVLHEDRVWTLLYRMDFKWLSGQGGAKLLVNPRDPSGPRTQIDVVAIDEEIGLAVECKSAAEPKKPSAFSEVIGKHQQLREGFTKAARNQFPSELKRYCIAAIFTNNLHLSDNDRNRAEAAHVVLFDDSDLTYYEALVDQIGPAARYQFLADTLPGREVPGLERVLPAVRTRMGGYRCYTFSAPPDYLLKISYVSHRAKGKASDVNAYQRMMKKSRLNSIREYIREDGIFPTNIVLNIPEGWLRFDRGQQKGDDRAATFGWLTLRPAYKAAWVIDGQHRLYAYSGEPTAPKSVLSVLAFEGLPASKQAQLFVDINGEQRKVKKSLLLELYAELHWDSEDVEVRTRAIASKAVQMLDADPSSPFFSRILKADEARTETRCITLTSLFQSLVRTGLYIESTKKGVIIYGPLWAGTNDRTVKRTVTLVNGWFEAVGDGAGAVWEKGAGPGGGLAMNDGVTVCMNVLHSVLQHYAGKGKKLIQLSDPELVEQVAAFAIELGAYFGKMKPEELDVFRRLRGVQGQTTGTRRCQEALSELQRDFQPPGLQEFVKREKAKTNERAMAAVLEIERMLQEAVLTDLKDEFGKADSEWFFEGVPKDVRKKVDDRINEASGGPRTREANFDLIDYRDIVLQNWGLFEETLARGKGNKKARTDWIVKVNEIRKTAAHASKGTHLPVSEEDLAFLDEIRKWLANGGSQGAGGR